VKPYDADEVFRTLNQVVAYDWKGFFTTRLQSKTKAIPLGGVEGGGYRLVYNTGANMFTDAWTLDGSVNALGSLGIHVGADGTVDDAWPDNPAFAAGLSNGMKIVAVNGRRYSSDIFSRALAASKTSTSPMELIVDNAGYFTTIKIDYHGGVRFPHLEHTPGAEDLLRTIAAPKIK
jgi:predicted metalloprotease with PDZ domain